MEHTRQKNLVLINSPVPFHCNKRGDNIDWAAQNDQCQHYLEVLIVLLIVLVQLMEVLGQLLGALVLVHVDVGVGGGVPGVVLGSGAHHYWQHIVPENISLEKKCRIVCQDFYPRPLTKNFSVM